MNNIYFNEQPNKYEIMMNNLVIQYACTEHDPYISFWNWLPTIGYAFKINNKIYYTFEDAWNHLQDISELACDNCDFTIVKIEENNNG